jgi:predicted nucleic acid-binding Zn finger protein
VKNYESERIEDILNSGRVKLHIFKPSSRKIWTVLSRYTEYWTDPDLQFCSCKNYYFKTLSNEEPCYHLKCVWQAREKKQFIGIEFHDSEFASFIKALLSDSSKELLRS